MVTDSIAFVSRRIAQTKARKLAQLCFRHFPAKKGTVTIHDFDGDLSISLERSSYISSAIYWAGHHSLHHVRFLRNYLTPEMTLVDVGANIGEITLFAAKKLNKGSVLAFEPSPEVFAQLSCNVALNQFNSVRLFNQGLYDKNCMLPIYLNVDEPYGIRNEGVTSLFPRGESPCEILIPLRRLDDVTEECELKRLDVLKIDVEGAEWNVLKGAEKTLREFRPVILMEISAQNFKRAGYSKAQIADYLDSLGYDLRNLADENQAVGDECDALCFPRKPNRPSIMTGQSDVSNLNFSKTVD
jgi:FkbM family methyltransferase